MKSTTPEPQDPWDKLHDADRDTHARRYEEMPPQERIKFTKGEIAFWTLFFLCVVGGICVGAIEIISMWLALP